MNSLVVKKRISSIACLIGGLSYPFLFLSRITFLIEDELCLQIAEIPQADGIKIIKRPVEEGKEEE